MENKKLFDLMEKMYLEFQEIKKDVKNNTDKIDKIDNVDKKVDNLEKIIIGLEQDHSKKFDSLLDAYRQNSEQLNRIENEVLKHEEVIFRRIK